MKYEMLRTRQYVCPSIFNWHYQGSANHMIRMWFAANILLCEYFYSQRITCFANHANLLFAWFAKSRIMRIIWFAWFAFLRIMRIIWFAWFAFLRIMRIIWFAWFAFLRIMRMLDSHDSQNMWFAANKNIRTEKYSQRITCESYDSQITGNIA